MCSWFVTKKRRHTSNSLVTGFQTCALPILGFGMRTALVITVSGAARELDRALRLQSHIYEVMILTGGLASTLRQAEGSLGRYVISGDRQLGRLYYEQWQRAGRQLARLGQVNGDDPGQQARIERLRTAYAQRGAALFDHALRPF